LHRLLLGPAVGIGYSVAELGTDSLGKSCHLGT
jgi:hypothetical protein